MKLWFSMLCLCIAPGAGVAQTLRGSPASVDLMYSSAHEKDLAFLQTRGDIYDAAVAGDLALISINQDLSLQRVKFPFVLPGTLAFADSLAVAYRAACGERLLVTSGARPIDEQPRNASPKSVHPTGMAVDFHKPSGACLTWLRSSLLALEGRGVIEATEERHPPHFHVAVLRPSPVGTQIIASAASALSNKPPARVATSEGEVSPPSQPKPAPDSAKAGSGSTYTVRAGDNLWTIARKHGTTTKTIQELNDLGTTRLRVGQQLKLP